MDIKKQIADVLEPGAKRHDGFLVKASAYYELEGVIIDLQRAGAEQLCIDTLKRVQKQIADVLKICEQL